MDIIQNMFLSFLKVLMQKKISLLRTALIVRISNSIQLENKIYRFEYSVYICGCTICHQLYNLKAFNFSFSTRGGGRHSSELGISLCQMKYSRILSPPFSFRALNKIDEMKKNSTSLNFCFLQSKYMANIEALPCNIS